MNIFTWLITGHLVGDWLLQNDWMAKGKKQALLTAPGMAHFIIYTLCVLTTLWFACGNDIHMADYLMAGSVIFLSHWFIDATDIVGVWIRMVRQTDMLMMRIMVDQTFHLLVLVGLALAF